MYKHILWLASWFFKIAQCYLFWTNASMFGQSTWIIKFIYHDCLVYKIARFFAEQPNLNSNIMGNQKSDKSSLSILINFIVTTSIDLWYYHAGLCGILFYQLTELYHWWIFSQNDWHIAYILQRFIICFSVKTFLYCIVI